MIDFNGSRLAVRGIILVQRFLDMDIMVEKVQDFFIGRIAQSADKHGHRHLAVTVDADGNGAGRVGLQFDPGAAVRNELGAVDFLIESVSFLLVVHAGRADQLGYDDTFSTVDDKGAGVGHNREITHEKVMFLQFSGLLVFQAHLHIERSRIIDVLRLALLDIILAFAEIVFAKMQRPLVRAVLNRGNICKYILQPFPAEPFIRLRLQIEQMRHFQDFL